MLRALTPLTVLCLLGCEAAESPVDIPFELRFGEAPIGCTEAVSGFTLSDLRLYVYDLELLSGEGAVALELVNDPPWQSERVALLDFENGEGTCRNGTPGVRTVVRGHAPPAEFRGLRLRVGVPERLNHADPLRAQPPLTDSAMHWHWTSGYKFLRAGIAAGDDGFWLHLGSTRCEGTVTDIEGCAASNRARVELTEYIPGEDIVVIDLERLVAGIDLDDGEPSDCSSGPAETTCAAAFDALGIDFGSGEAVRSPAPFLVRTAP